MTHLPPDLHNIVMSFHDVFDIVTKKERINFIIKCGFADWLSSKGCFNRIGSPSDITSYFPYSPHFFLEEYCPDIFPTTFEWSWFIGCFLNAEKNLNRYPFTMTRMNLLF